MLLSYLSDKSSLKLVICVLVNVHINKCSEIHVQIFLNISFKCSHAMFFLLNGAEIGKFPYKEMAPFLRMLTRQVKISLLWEGDSNISNHIATFYHVIRKI